MGAANTKNVTEAVSSVTNTIANSTTANNNQINETSNNVDFDHCYVKADNIDIDEISKTSVISQQIADATSNTDLRNNISQSILQEAASTVGTMGVGYASASNSASVFANSSNSITNDVETVSNQINSSSNSFICRDSTIITDDLRISLGNAQDFLSEQTLKQNNTSKVVNDISQSVTQKATAKVEGITGLFLAIAIIIGVFGYAISKPLDTKGGKILIIVLLVIGLSALTSYMYIKKTPPFFNDIDKCSPVSDMGGCKDKCDELTNQTINIEMPPLRYIFPLLPTSSNTKNGNLLQICVAALGKQGSGDEKYFGNNGGYNKKSYDNFNTYLEKHKKLIDSLGDGIRPIPNVLKLPKNNKGKLLKIPVEYMIGKGNSGSGSKCTPGVLQVENGSEGDYTNCNISVDPSNLDEAQDDTPSEEIITVLNADEWKQYINDKKYGDKRALLSRFLFLNISTSDIDLSMYIDENEIVSVKDKNKTIYKIAKDCDKDCNIYKYEPNVPPVDFSEAIIGKGTLTGNYGICVNNTYKFQKFFRNIMSWVILLCILGVILYIIFKKR